MHLKRMLHSTTLAAMLLSGTTALADMPKYVFFFLGDGMSATQTQAAEAYKAQTVAEAQGEAQRFLSVYEQYRLAPEVTRERIYLETMERVLGNSSKIILDGEGVVPYLPLDQLRPKPSEPASTGGAR